MKDRSSAALSLSSLSSDGGAAVGLDDDDSPRPLFRDVSASLNDDPIDVLFPSIFPPPHANADFSTTKVASTRFSAHSSDCSLDFDDYAADDDDYDAVDDASARRGHRRPPRHMHPLNLARSGSVPSSLGTFIIDDTAPEVGGNYNIEDYSGGHSQFHKRRHTELKRSLSTRHIQMIAVGSVLGNGLFIGTGKILGNSGPLGMLLGFLITGLIVFSVMVSFGEMVALIPIAGGISAFGSRFVDDALGFSLGLCYWFSLAIAIPTQVAQGAVLLTYFELFDPWRIYPAVMVVSVLFVIIVINLLDVRIYGEIEYIFGQIKLIFLLAMIIFMFILNRNYIKPQMGETIFPVGLLYWDQNAEDYGPFRPYFKVTTDIVIGGSKGRFLMVWTAVVQAVYCFSGVELVALTAGEVKHPRKALPRATLRIFTRIFILYVLGVFAAGLNVAADNSALPGFFTPWSEYNAMKFTWVFGSTGLGNCESGTLGMKGFSNTNSSPWVIAMQNAGMCTGSAVLTVVFMFCAWSAGNSFLYASSRTLYAMAIQGKAPRVFGYTTRRGVPYVSVLFTFAIAMTVFLVSFPNATAITVYYWIRRLTSIPGTLVWAGICLSYIRFYYGLKLRPDIVQRDQKSYPYRSPLQPYTAYFGLFGCILLVIFNDMTIFVEFQWQYLIASYISLVVWVICFVAYKLWRRTRLVPLVRMDLDLGRREMDQYEAETEVEMRMMMEKGLWGNGRRIVRWIKVMLI
ncbi:amino acid permease-domain-containing protein [Limtongia smithiae]|uniref:amino acid permease-domain-containing protein n=1 Tax=Limtongia smithiae TaxID=1125753 RepID=UPI0034CE65F0